MNEPQTTAQAEPLEAGEWYQDCAVCDDPAVMDEPGIALHPECVAKWRAIRAAFTVGRKAA